MNYELFDINKFNVLEDEKNYYVFRALNREDHDDIINSYLEKTEAPDRIRTDRERFEKSHGIAKYNKDSEISLEEVYDHIKIHHIKETNCISLSSNSCVALDYGGSYYGEYAIIKKSNKDKGQREFCGCMKSKDIGEYNTCPHLCEYCYANTSKESAVSNWKQHKNNPLSETITGR